MLLYKKMEDVYNKNLDISLKYMIESYSLFYYCIQSYYSLFGQHSYILFILLLLLYIILDFFIVYFALQVNLMNWIM